MSSSSLPIPLILLAGSSRRYDQMPADGQGHHPLSGYKAASLRLGDKPLIEHVCDSFRACGAFDPIYVAGPEAVYRDFDLGGALIIDSDGNFGENLKTATEHVATAHPKSQVAYATADVLPSLEDLKIVLDDFEACSPCSFWMLECREPAESQKLGTSTWKPKYWIRSEHDEVPVPTLPGHLVIATPEGTRRQLLYEIFDIAYNTRNTSIEHRLWVVTLGMFASLLRADWRRIRSGRLPISTLEILINGLHFTFRLRQGIDHEVMAKLLRRVFLLPEYRRGRSHEKGRVAVLDVLTLARDVDTREEAQELGLSLGNTPVSQ